MNEYSFFFYRRLQFRIFLDCFRFFGFWDGGLGNCEVVVICFFIYIYFVVLIKKKINSNRCLQIWEFELLSVVWFFNLDLCFNGFFFFLVGVFLYVMGDVLGLVIVVIIVIIFYVRFLKIEDSCNWQCYIDFSLIVVMVIIILLFVFLFIKEIVVIFLQMVFKGVNMEELSKSENFDLELLFI